MEKFYIHDVTFLTQNFRRLYFLTSSNLQTAGRVADHRKQDFHSKSCIFLWPKSTLYIRKRLKISHSTMLKDKDSKRSVFIPPSYEQFNLTFLHPKCDYSLIRICCEYFRLSKLFSWNIVFNYAQRPYWIEGLRKNCRKLHKIFVWPYCT